MREGGWGDRRGLAKTPRSFKKVKTSFLFHRGGGLFFRVYPPYPPSHRNGHLSNEALKIYGVAYALGGQGFSAHLRMNSRRIAAKKERKN